MHEDSKHILFPKGFLRLLNRVINKKKKRGTKISGSAFIRNAATKELNEEAKKLGLKPLEE